MKIIYSDNIPTEQSSETLWLDRIVTEPEVTLAERVCDKLNERLNNYQGPFYKLVNDDHKLYKWEP